MGGEKKKYRRVLEKIKREKNASYIVNPAGDILEFKTIMKKIGEVPVKEGKKYMVNIEGEVIEADVITMTTSEFYKAKKSGELAQLFRDGAEVDVVPDKDASLAELQKLDQESFGDELRGRTILDVAVKDSKDGTREITLLLDNGKRLVLRQGLLIKGSTVEII